MTSRCHDAEKLSSKQMRIPFQMASLSITSLFSFFEETKSIRKGENHYKSDHVEYFAYQQGVLRGEVHASMKKKVYKVTVSLALIFSFFAMSSTRVIIS